MDGVLFEQYFRMTRDNFDELLGKVGQLITKAICLLIILVTNMSALGYLFNLTCKDPGMIQRENAYQGPIPRINYV